MRKISLPYLILVVFFLAVVGAPLYADAATNIIGLPTGDSITDYISKLYTFGLGIGGILAVLMIVIGGILYSVSGAVDQKAEGKSMILSALFGLVLLFGSFLLLKTINPQLIILKNPGPGGQLTQVKLAAADCTQSMGLPECSAGQPPVNPSTGRCQCYERPQSACPEAVVNACPRRVVIPAGRDVAATVQGLYPIKDSPFPWLAYYNESENIRDDEIVWQYPYYVGEGASSSSALQPYIGPANARCIIYAERECYVANPLVRNQPLTGCPKQLIQTNRIDLQSWVKPC